jgi:hypothetical protein
MGTLREQMARAIQEWDKEDEQPIQEKTVEKKQTTTAKIVGFIRDNPNIESTALRDKVAQKYPDITFKNIASILKQLTDANYLARQGSTIETARGSRQTFTYTVVPDDIRIARRKAQKNKMKGMVERAAMARAAKEAKREARTTQVGISDLVPEKKVGEMGTAMKSWRPATVEWRADDVINSLSVIQARELYDRLKQIFGG